MKTKKLYTKSPLAFRSIRLHSTELHRWQKAAGRLGISQSAFLRKGLEDEARKVLSARSGGVR